jgi:hypothetical protein
MSLCQFGNGMFVSGPAGSVVASHGNHLHGRRGRGFDAARWDMSRRVGFCCGKLGFVLETTIVLARRPIDAAVVG